jgi:Flp pilus assembly protein TadB
MEEQNKPTNKQEKTDETVKLGQEPISNENKELEMLPDQTTDEDKATDQAPKKVKRRQRRQRRQRRGNRENRVERIRLIPIWLRIVFVILLVGLSAIAGLIIGYGVIGKGVPTDALKIETWQHILDIINGVGK